MVEAHKGLNYLSFIYFSGVVIIRCDIVKGKANGNQFRPGFDATPRNQDGYVLDLGNIGKLKWT